MLLNIYKFSYFVFFIFFSSFTYANSLSIFINSGLNPTSLECPKSPSTKKFHSIVTDPKFPPTEDDIDFLLKDTGTTLLSSEIIIPDFINKSITPSIAFWGDSHLSAGFFSDRLIEIFGLNKSDVTPKFIPPTMGRIGVNLPITKYCQFGSWNFEYSFRSSSNSIFSPSLVKLNSKKEGSFLWLDFRNDTKSFDTLDKLDLLLGPIGSDTSIKISLNDGSFEVINLSASLSNQVLSINSDKSFSIFKISLLSGELSINGFIPHYTKISKLNLDLFALPGATIKGFTNNLLITLPLDYDIAIFAFGTNEGNDTNFNSFTYATELHKSLTTFKNINPNSICVLIGPPDRGVLISKNFRAQKRKIPRDYLLKYSKIHNEISKIQKASAEKFNCFFWDWQSAMGGVGGSYRWFKSDPRLMSKDLVHLTKSGYQLSSELFEKDLRLKQKLGF